MNRKGQATLEYIVTIVLTVSFIAFLLFKIDPYIRQWWDTLARKVAAPCPTKACVEKHTKPTIP